MDQLRPQARAVTVLALLGLAASPCAALAHDGQGAATAGAGAVVGTTGGGIIAVVPGGANGAAAVAVGNDCPAVAVGAGAATDDRAAAAVGAAGPLCE